MFIYCESFLLQNKFSDILALLFILQDDYDRARYYTGTCLQTFLEVRSLNQLFLGGIC
jgi:hypothetical protein